MNETLPEFAPDWRTAREAVTACPKHEVTPLVHIDVEGSPIWIKDEGKRFDMGSFKALGGIHAIMELMRDHHASHHADGVRPPLEALFDDAHRERQRNVNVVCASAGNHGVAVATAARLLGAEARIHLSREVPEAFASTLRGLGASVVRSGDTYEASLVAAKTDAEESGAWLVADTAWDGYVEIPERIMAGYSVIAEELRDAFMQAGHWPTDVYLQAGVGGLAGAMTWMIRHRWPVQPRIVIVEPEAAPCLAQSAREGRVATVSGPVSSMGRLDCKCASPLAVDALRQADVDYLAIDDATAEKAVALLSDHGHASTPSGAAGFAAWMLEKARDTGIGERPLVILSEGAID